MEAHMSNANRRVNDISISYHIKVMKHEPEFPLSALKKTSQEFGICHKRN